MRNRCLLLALALGFGALLSFTQPQQAVRAGDDKGDRVGQLIKQLGSPKFAIRDRAKKELEAMGTKALEALRQAAKSNDMETSRRASELVKKFEDKIAVDNLLAPKKVNLKLKDVTVLEAVEELSKQSGYPIQIDGDRTQLAKRKITLVTGDTTFWQAFDQLCQKGSLTDVTNSYNPYGGPIYRGGVGGGVIQPLPINPPPRIIKGGPAIMPIQPPVIQPGIKLQPGILQPLPGIQDKNAKEMLDRMQKVLEQLQKELEQNGNGQFPKLQPGLKPLAPALQPAQLQKELQKMLEQIQKENPNLPALPPLPQFKPVQGGFFQAQPVQNGPVQIKAVPVQQLPVAQAQPAFQQPIRGGKGVIRQPIRVNNNGQITVRDGAAQKYPTSYAGAVRVRVVPMDPQQGVPNVAKQAGEIVLVLEATGEPRMQGFAVNGSAMIDKALDDVGQSLFVTMADPQMDNGGFGPNGNIRITRIYNPYNLAQRHVVVRLKVGEKKSGSLKELKGSLTAQMLSAPEALITFDNLMKAAGKEAKGANGGKVEIVAVEKLNNNDVKIQIRLENVQNINGNININGRVPVGSGFNTTQGVATVRDAKGKEFQFAGQTYHSSRFVNGVINQEVSLTFRPNGAGDAAALVFNGHRMVTMQVPFSFTNVPLQ